MAKKKAPKKAAARPKAPRKTAKSGAKNSLVGNINRRKKAGKSRSKKKSTISKEAYSEMQKGWPKKKKKKSS